MRAHRWRLAGAALILLAAALAAAPAPARAQEPQPKLTDILVLGNKNINRESIISASGLKVGDPLTQATLDEAKRRLLQTGNFGMRQVNPEDGVKVRADIANDEAKVVIEVDENDKVEGITITGSGPIEPAKIQALMSTKQGQVLNLQTLQADITKIRTAYEELGYQAFVSDGLVIENGILKVPIVVGVINSVKVTGLTKTRPSVVLRVMKQKPGEYYNVLRLRKDLTAILNTDLFENVEPSFTFPAAGKVDVTLNITEKRTGTVEAGIGYGSRGLVGRAAVAENNLLGRGQQASILWEAGGRANRNSVELSFTEPWLDRRNTSLSVSLFDKTVYRFGQRIGSIGGGGFITDEDVYFETHAGGQVTLSRPFGEAFRGFVGFRYDNVKVPSLALDLTDARVLQNGPLSTVTLRVTHNTRDFDLEPASGGYEILSTDIGRADLRPVQTSTGQIPVGVFGQLNYTRFGIDARRYFSPEGRRLQPKDRRRVIALRLMLGSSAGTLPFSEQYFVGGAETLRGYEEDRFWGDHMLLGSIEYRHPLAPSLTGVVFTDVGDAWGGPYQNVRSSGFTQHSKFSPSVGFGLGLRVVTPIGPIRIDQGFGSEGANTHFSVGHVF